MLADYNQVIHILDKCTTFQIKQAENQIRALMLDGVQMFACLHNALKDNMVNHDMKVLAASFINTSIFENRTQYTQSMMFETMKNIMIDNFVDQKYKKILVRALTQIMQINDQEHLQQWQNLTYQILHKSNQFLPAFLIIQSLAAAQVHSAIIFRIIDNVFNSSFNLNIFSSACIEEWLQIQEIIIAWKMVYDVLINYEAYSYIMYMANSASFCEAIYHIYNAFSTSNNYFCFYNSTNINVELSTKINEIKADTSQIHLKILMQSTKGYEITALVTITAINVDKLVNSLYLGAVSPDFITDNQGQNLLLYLFQILKNLFMISPDMFASNWKNLINYIILPFLKINDEEMQQFDDNPMGYLQLFEDCCEHQKIQIIKTQAAQFLQRISDAGIKNQAFKDVTQYIINKCMVSIKHHLNLQHYIQNQQYDLFPLQTSFLILSIFAYCIGHYPNILSELKIILCDNRITRLPPLQLSRVFLFLSYNYCEVFPIENEGYHWVQISLSLHQNKTVQHCALDFVFNVIETVYNNQAIKALIKRIPGELSQNFWHLLRKIMKYHLNKIPQDLAIQLVTICMRRYQLQLSKLESAKIKKTYDAINILNVFKSIMSSQLYLKDKPKLKNSIWSCTRFYSQAVKYNFQDEMIQLINYFLNSSTTADIHTQQYLNFLEQLKLQFKMENLPQNHFFIALNNYIIKGQFGSVVYPIFQMLLKTFDKLTEKLNQNPSHLRQKIVIGHHMILFYNILYISNGKILAQDANRLYEIMNRFLPSSKYDAETDQIIYDQFFDKCLSSRAINIQYMLCLIQNQCNSQVISNVIQTLEKLHQMKIYYGYDVKILAMCIKWHIGKLKDINLIKVLLSVLTKVIYLFLQRLKVEKQLQKKYKQENQRNPSTKVILSKTISYEGILKLIVTPFSQQIKGNIRDKYRELINNLTQNNVHLFQSIFSSMSETLQVNMQKIINKKNNNQSLKNQNINQQITKSSRKILKITGTKDVINTATKEFPQNMDSELEDEQSQQNPIKSHPRQKVDDQSDEQLKKLAVVRKRRKKCQ